MQRGTTIEAVLKRDRALVLAGLAVIAALAWAYMIYLAWDMSRMGPAAGSLAMTMSPVRSWGPVDFFTSYIMWAVMMVAMMAPTAAPMLLLFSAISRKRLERQQPFVPTGIFLSGYLMVWLGFATVATLAQWGFHQATLLSSMMGSATPILGGIILVAAGVFQWTPIKYSCLRHCRTPLGFIMTEWREGARGALIMGTRHGAYCLGCCWFLMGLMFVAGVMNILWMALVAAYMLLEKVVPAGHWLSRAAGVCLIGWGTWTMVATLV